MGGTRRRDATNRVVFAAALLVAAMSPAVASQASPASASARWRIVPSPDPGPHAQLYAVDALSATDAWAVGQYSDRPSLTLIEHWDGTSWTVVRSPRPHHRGAGEGLSGVLALASDDVWAVGSQALQTSDGTLIEHWDGSRWSVVSSPSPGQSDDLDQVMRHGPNGRLWAVGARQTTFGGPFSPLVLEWNGERWRVIPSQNPPAGGYLFDGASGSRDDAWVIGSVGVLDGTLAEHWDGSSWSAIPTPDTGFGSELNGVAVVSPADAWAVGQAFGTLIERWDGTAWSVVPSPSRTGGSLEAVQAASADEVWAVGLYRNNGAYRTLTELWDGAAWSVVPSANRPAECSLIDVAMVPGTDQVWAVGLSTPPDGSDAATLIELYS
jgi:hypothetical protein